MFIIQIFLPLPPQERAELAKFWKENVRTTPRDPKFPSANQAGHCWNRYNEWILCQLQQRQVGVTDDTERREACHQMRLLATNMCPSEWVEEWDEKLEDGTFVGVQLYDTHKAEH